MFHTLITLAYSIPGIYLFIRIWQLFIPKRRRVLYIFTFLIIFIIYPLSNFIGEGREGTVSRIFSQAASYLLPLFLYIFLLVLLTDLLLLINLVIRVVPKENVRDKKRW